MVKHARSHGRAAAAIDGYSSNDDEVVIDAPKSKKAKSETKANKESGMDKTTAGGSAVPEGAWGLDTSTRNPKRVTVGEFAGKQMINVREYYTDRESGEVKPGKKGIALNVAQWNELLKAVPEINALLRAKGEEVEYGDGHGNGEGGGRIAGNGVERSCKGEKVVAPSKANIEATDSDDE